MGGFGILVIVLAIWMIVCRRIIFTKTGEKGWKSLIPLLNAYIFCKIINKRHWFWFIGLGFLIIMLTRFLVSLYSWFMLNGLIDLNTFELQTTSDFETFRSGANRGLGMLSLSYIIVTLVFVIIMQICLGKAFRKSARFCLGLVLINPLFIGILAFERENLYLK